MTRAGSFSFIQRNDTSVQNGQDRGLGLWGVHGEASRKIRSLTRLFVQIFWPQILVSGDQYLLSSWFREGFMTCLKEKKQGGGSSQ